MIRFLQKENRLTKALFVVIIGAASVSMVGLPDPWSYGPKRIQRRHVCRRLPAWYSRFFSAGEVISQQKVAQLATQRVQQQYPQ